MTDQAQADFDDDIDLDEGCRCASVRMAPCSWCESHEEGCEWPDVDCECNGGHVAAVHRPLTDYQLLMGHPDLGEVNTLLEEYYR